MEPRVEITLFCAICQLVEILPNFFGEITRHQFSAVAASLKIHGAVAAEYTGAATRIDSSVKEAAQDLSMSPGDKSRRHRSQREISRQLGISKWSVYPIQKQVGLKRYQK